MLIADGKERGKEVWLKLAQLGKGGVPGRKRWDPEPEGRD